MAMVLPTLPSLPAGYIVQQPDMNDLAYCCTFLLGKPISSVYDSAGSQALSTSAVAISWGSINFDPDGMWSSGAKTQLTIQTPGWYKIRYNIYASGAGSTLQTYAVSTTGANNPAGSGQTSADCWPSYCETVSSPGGGCGASGVWPFYLYAGDYIQVYAIAGATGGSTVAGASALSLEFVSLY